MNDSGEFQDTALNFCGYFLTFPANQQSFRVLDLCKAATNACHLIHEICLNHRETFFGNPRPLFDSTQTPFQGILHSTTPSATGAVPVQASTGNLSQDYRYRSFSSIKFPLDRH